MNATSKADNTTITPSIFMLQTILAAPDGVEGGGTVSEGGAGGVVGVVEPEGGGGLEGVVVGGLPVGLEADATTLIASFMPPAQ